MVVFGEDVAAKGGVYGVTKGPAGPVRRRRVFDTLLDETSILGPGARRGAGRRAARCRRSSTWPTLHNAEDQLRGEAATLQFFSPGAYRNPMVVRMAGLAYQEGFGGHFHNDNSVAVLRDIPGLVVAVPARAEDAAAMLRTCLAAAEVDGSVCVFLEPIALYHTRDLHTDGDNGWLRPVRRRRRSGAGDHVPIGRARVYGGGEHLTIVTFGNGVRMSLRVAARLAERGVGMRVVDLRWLDPLPVADIWSARRRLTGRVLVVDETRRSGGVGEGVLAALVDAGYVGAARRVAAVDSFRAARRLPAQCWSPRRPIDQGARSLLAR